MAGPVEVAEGGGAIIPFPNPPRLDENGRFRDCLIGTDRRYPGLIDE